MDDAGTGRLLDAYVGGEDGEAIQTAALAIRFSLTIDNLSGALFPCLTQVDGLRLAALGFEKAVTMRFYCAVYAWHPSGPFQCPVD